MAVKLMTIDIDGTLLNDAIKVSDENLQAIEKALDQGVEIVPASGRAFGFLPEEIRKNPRIRYAITSNGSSVYDKKENKVLLFTPMKKKETEKIFEILDGYDAFVEPYAGGNANIEESFKNRLDDFIPEEYVESFLAMEKFLTKEEYQDLRKNGEIEKFNLFFRTKDDLEGACLQFEEAGIPFIRTAEGGVEIMDRSVSKGSALADLCSHLQIRPDEVLAIGDSLNDLTMLQFAGLGVAVGNALPPVKDAADEITVSNNENAVAHIIEERILDTKKPVTVYCYSRCSTCKKALAYLDEEHVPYQTIDLITQTPDEKTLHELIERSGLPIKRFFNTSGMKYRELGLKDKLPEMTPEEQLKLLATDGMLIKRPILVMEDAVLPGFRPAQWAEALGVDA